MFRQAQHERESESSALVPLDPGKPFRARHDGFTPARRAKFVRVLSQTGCVADAARSVGLTTTSAYRARRRIPEFASAWRLALVQAEVDLEQIAWQRAVEGVETPIVRSGKVVGTHRKPSDAMLRLLLTRGGKAAMSGASWPVGEAPDDLVTREEHRAGWGFDAEGVKRTPEERKAEEEALREALVERLNEIAERLGLDGEDDEEDGGAASSP